MKENELKSDFKLKNKFKEAKGSITLFVLVSMLFFSIVVIGAYMNSNYKVQEENKEIEKIKKEYDKTNINEIYDEAYSEYFQEQTPTIEVYEQNEKTGEIVGEKRNLLKTVFVQQQNVVLKFKSINENDEYVYSEGLNEEKHDVVNDQLSITATTGGKEIYVYLKDENENLSENYTAINLKLTNT